MPSQPTRRDAPYAPGETSLLLVDMQKIWCERTPGHDGGDYYHDRLDRLVVPNQQRLLAAARAAGVDVLHTVIESLTRHGRDRSLDHKLSDMHVPKGAPEGQVIDALAPLVDEIVLPKTSSGVFNSTNIDYVLRNLGTRMLIVAGVITDQCVDMAVRDAADRGYLVTLVTDACATYTPERDAAALAAFAGYCWETDTDTVVARLEALRAA
ncbi:isochorismatase [Pseudoroseomonas deserti]|uniref:Isochorismatase n=1 Tax=Teichococcus deserti TaxID=1817963 RepID=A0A1V2GUC5_9PROT|nr:isochorismatase family cysteine hydrolase [Pseudoroseomonas deserti]ONG45071.1 isochorismatase [Pseudoroseomonas deserti]